MSNTRRPRNQTLSQQSAPKGTQAVIMVVALLCVGAIIGLALVLRGGDTTQPVASAAGSTSGASVAPSTSAGTPSSAATSALPANLHCDPAPAPPGQPQTYQRPPPKSLSRGATWKVTLSTNCGAITMLLDGAKAPQTVASFLFLSRKGFFDGSPCPRLTTGGLSVLQCGDPTGTGGGNPGYAFGIENAPRNGDYPTGTVAMARQASPKTNGSQFFIVYGDSTLPTDTGGYSIFGQVTKGLGIVKALGEAGVSGGGNDSPPPVPVSVLSVTVTRA